jgi:hypothetical protein
MHGEVAEKVSLMINEESAQGWTVEGNCDPMKTGTLLQDWQGCTYGGYQEHKRQKIDCGLGWSFPAWKIRRPQSSGEIIF